MAVLVCLDVDGTVCDGVLGPALPGAVEAVQAIAPRYAVRFVSNATSVTPARLAEHLRELGLLRDPAQLVTPLVIAKHVLPGRGHDRGLLLCDPEVRGELAWFSDDPAAATVLLTSELHAWPIEALQPAFRRLLDGAHFYAVQRNRYYRAHGQLVTDVGPVVAFLEHAAGVRAQLLGKPAVEVFDYVAQSAGISRANIVMVGDDAEYDVAASVALGMGGVLVRTGKYRPGDEGRVQPTPTAVLSSIAALPAWLARACL